MDSDSLWLQKSIHLSDPIPDSTAMAAAVASNPQASNEEEVGGCNTEKKTAEIELTKTPFCLNSTKVFQRPSQLMPNRLSVSNTAFTSLQEIDELRARVSQLTRERLKWSGSQRDLEIARFEVAQVREELKTMRDYSKAIKSELDAANARGDRESKARQTLEAQLNDMISQRESENHFLRQQLDALKDEQSQRLAELADQTETERASRADALREQIVQMSEELANSEARHAELEEAYTRLQTEHEETRVALSTLQERHGELQSSVDGYTARCADLEKLHTEFVANIEASHEEALKSHITLSEERVHQLTVTKDETIKDLQEELKSVKEKSRTLSEDLSSLRHRYNQLEEDARQAELNHEKETKRIRDEHRLIICQHQLQTETLVREAKGGRLSIEEEKLSLKRQLVKISEELSTVTTILAQRERHIANTEKELNSMKESVMEMEQRLIATARDAETAREALVHADERIERLVGQQEETDQEYSKDLSELKNQLAVAQDELVKFKAELSTATQERIKEETESRAIIAELRENLEQAGCEKSSAHQLLREKKQAEELAEEYRSKYLSVCKKAENLDIELVAVSSRCGLLEKRLDEELRRSLRNASVSPTPDRYSSIMSRKPLRSTSSVNVPHTANSQNPSKKSRSVEPRVFTISGFENSELFTEIKQLPYATVAECRSNSPVSSNLTHLVTNGQLTIKLLTALVRGCWILPEEYVHHSIGQKRWLNEETYGFRHKDLPLASKRVGFTGGFASSRHYSTASLVISEGGAVTESNLSVADFVLCTHNELETLEGVNALTWDKMVELIYPVKVGHSGERA